MWNKLLGRQSDPDDTTNTPAQHDGAGTDDGAGMDEGGSNDDASAPLSMESEAGQTVMSEDGTDVPSGTGGKRLVAAMSPEGPRVNVRVTVQNESVSASNSAAEDDDGTTGSADGGDQEGEEQEGEAEAPDEAEGGEEGEDAPPAAEEDAMEGEFFYGAASFFGSDIIPPF